MATEAKYVVLTRREFEVLRAMVEFMSKATIPPPPEGADRATNLRASLEILQKMSRLATTIPVDSVETFDAELERVGHGIASEVNAAYEEILNLWEVFIPKDKLVAFRNCRYADSV